MADWQVEFQPEQVTDMPGSSVSPVSPALPLPSADWKLNMSFVSQGWASIQSRLGVGPNARRSFDFMQKKWWNSRAASLAAVLCWYENTTLHYSCLHFTRVADRLTPNSCSYRPFFFLFLFPNEGSFGISVTFDRPAALPRKRTKCHFKVL